MKRPAHLTLVDADKIGAVFTQRTEWRERAEKAEARNEALEKIAADKVALNEHCAALETRIEALERLRQLVENDKGHIFCACGRCEETLKQLAALRGEEKNEPETFCPACDAGVGQCNGPHKGNAGEVPY